MDKTLINNIAIWAAIVGLLFLGLQADTGSVQRDFTSLTHIETLQKSMISLQSLVIQMAEEKYAQ